MEKSGCRDGARRAECSHLLDATSYVTPYTTGRTPSVFLSVSAGSLRINRAVGTEPAGQSAPICSTPLQSAPICSTPLQSAPPCRSNMLQSAPPCRSLSVFFSVSRGTAQIRLRDGTHSRTCYHMPCMQSIRKLSIFNLDEF